MGAWVIFQSRSCTLTLAYFLHKNIQAKIQDFCGSFLSANTFKLIVEMCAWVIFQSRLAHSLYHIFFSKTFKKCGNEWFFSHFDAHSHWRSRLWVACFEKILNHVHSLLLDWFKFWSRRRVTRRFRVRSIKNIWNTVESRACQNVPQLENMILLSKSLQKFFNFHDVHSISEELSVNSAYETVLDYKFLRLNVKIQIVT